MVIVDRKNKDAMSCRLKTRVMMASNELPKLYDGTNALGSRFMVLVTRRSFFGKEDQNLSKRLMKGLPGILKLGPRWIARALQERAIH